MTKPLILNLNEDGKQTRRMGSTTLEVPEYFQGTIRFHSFEEWFRGPTRVLMRIVDGDESLIDLKILMKLEDFSKLLSKYVTAEYSGKLKFKRTAGYPVLTFVDF